MTRRIGVLATVLLLSLLTNGAAHGRDDVARASVLDRALASAPVGRTGRRIERSSAARADLPFDVRDVASGVGLEARLVGARPVIARSRGDVSRFEGALGRGTELVQRVDARGVEDFIAFGERPSEESLTYSVDTSRAAGVRFVARTLELLDAAGTPRVRMAPPWLLDAHGSRFEIDVSVTGCAYDTDPRAPSGRPLTAPGAACEVTLAWGEQGVAYPIVVDPTWSATDSLATARREMAIAYLASTDDVVVAGGIVANDFTSVTATASTELYDVSTETFAATTPMPTARAHPQFVRLDDDRMFVTGGSASGSGAGTVVVGGAVAYVGSTATWGTLAGPTVPRVWAEAVTLADGRVLLAGGKIDHYYSSSTVASMELYDPAGNAWTSGPAMGTARYGNFVLVRLASGSVLAAGGFQGLAATPVAAEVYDPVASTWAPTGPMTLGRGTALYARLASGDVLVAGGTAVVGGVYVTTATSEIYRVATGTWEAAGAIGAPVDYRTNGALLFPDGRVVAPAGIGTRGLYSETFDVATSTWGSGCDPSRGYLVAVGSVLLPDGRAFVVGGVDATGLRADAWLSGMESAACDDGNGCTTDSCEPATGCVYTPNTMTCDDGDACTSGDVCAASSCAGTVIAGCGDAAVEDDAAVAADAATVDAAVVVDAATPLDAAVVVDAATPVDAAAFDAGGTGRDAGATVATSGGCGCRVSARAESAGAIALAMLVLLGIVSRRRARGAH